MGRVSSRGKLRVEAIIKNVHLLLISDASVVTRMMHPVSSVAGSHLQRIVLTVIIQLIEK